MRKISGILTALFSVFAAFSQNTIKLNINHKLGNNTFAVNQTATNNLGHSFELNRMQYYMSGFVITHDGSQTTTLTGIYALVDAAAPAQIDLGSYPGITNVEAIKFSIGVNTPENNADPSLWPASHALAPKSPSMHWGWSSGYFFIALGGNSSPSLNQQLELHALGNANYFSQTIVTTASVSGNEKIITINADYEMALKNITISSGLVLHGSSGANATMVTNFKNFVFTAPSITTVGIDESDDLKKAFTIYPNPSDNGTFTLTSLIKGDEYSYQITDITGKIVGSGKLNSVGVNQITIATKGIYIATLFEGNAVILNQKLVVQ
jgi:hypothetical protein